MKFLLDTKVLSEVTKPRPHPGVATWMSGVGSTDLRLSVLVVGEVRQGVERLRPRDPDRAGTLDQWLDELVRRFSGRIAPVSLEVAETWGRLNSPDPLPAVDGLLAATALVHDWTVVTRNEGDFARTGVRLLNPFQPA